MAFDGTGRNAPGDLLPSRVATPLREWLDSMGYALLAEEHGAAATAA
jgi:hypothetical protein